MRAKSSKQRCPALCFFCFCRFDCHPETKVDVTEDRCIARGCHWHETNIPGVPACYYPSGYGAYKKDSAPMPTTAGKHISFIFVNVCHFQGLNNV